jgi:hypothetical protein
VREIGQAVGEQGNAQGDQVALDSGSRGVRRSGRSAGRAPARRTADREPSGDFPRHVDGEPFRRPRARRRPVQRHGEVGEREGAAVVEPGLRGQAATRLDYRAGYSPSALVTRVGELELRVPQDRPRPVLDRAFRALPASGTRAPWSKSFEMKLETLKPRLEPALGLSALRGP